MEFSEIAEETRAIVFESLSTVEFHEGAAETLSLLKTNRKTLTLETSSARHLIDHALNAHRLGRFFDSVVGDSHVDIQVGKASGCRTCWFAPAHNNLFHEFGHVRSLSPDHEISTIQKLVDIT